MTFHEALALQPEWVRVWVLWLNIASFGALTICLFARASWGIAAAILAANVPMVVAMQALYEQVGFVRLLGLPHLIFWPPLLGFILWKLRRDGQIRAPQRQALWVLVDSLMVSLGFDLADVARYLLGERDSLVAAPM
ncbi:MAG: hypothetical protein ACFBRM_11510 [Pikeienuella sp.]